MYYFITGVIRLRGTKVFGTIPSELGSLQDLGKSGVAAVKNLLLRSR
jgi:hypothetical protein